MGTKPQSEEKIQERINELMAELKKVQAKEKIITRELRELIYNTK